MSDFLTNLVSRTLQAVDPVQPRVPALFEPVTAPAFVEEITQNTAPTPDQPATTAPRYEPAQAAPAAAHIATPAPLPAAHEALPLETPEVKERRQAPTPAVRVERVVTEREVVLAPLITRETRVLESAHERNREPEEKMPRVQFAASRRETALEPPRQDELKSARPAAALREIPHERVEHHDTIERFTIERVEKTQPSGPEPRPSTAQREPAQFVQPRVELPDLPEFPAAPMPEPVIEVTIGRIEIRSAAPDIKPQIKPKTHVPALSLQDYLKQRAGGR